LNIGSLTGWMGSDDTQRCSHEWNFFEIEYGTGNGTAVEALIFPPILLLFLTAYILQY